MIKINIPASKIAACVGMNPYTSIIDTIYDTFKFKNKGTFEKLQVKNLIHENDILNLTNVLNMPNNSSIQDLQNEFKKKLSNYANNDNKSNELLNSINNDSLKEVLNSEIRMRKGVLNETKDLDRLQKKENIQIIERNSILGSLIIIISKKYEIKITGRADGYNAERKCLIESKHRKNRLFGHVPEYERVQCEVYMRMFDCDKCYHTETYMENSNETLLEKDDILWKKITRSLRKEFIPEYLKIMEIG